VTVQDFGLSKRRRDVLARLLEQLSGVPVVWANEPLIQIPGDIKALITLKIRTIQTKDSWEKITTSTTVSTQTRLGNQSVATVEVKIESFDPEIYADQIFQSLTTRMYRDRFRAILHTGNMAIGDNSDWQDLPTVYDNRVISCGAGSIRLAFADLDPLTDTLDTWIETVNAGQPSPGDTNIIPGDFGASDP
jgi:hypothetical protein